MSNDIASTAISDYGFSSQSIRQLAADYGISLKTLACIIGCTSTKIYNKPIRLPTGSAQRFLQLSDLMCLATDYFGSLSRAKKWFVEYNLGLDAKPLQLCETEQGIKRVKNAIVRLAAGMTA
ncbi:hypothetical protein Glaag_0412 [Glaciecola sp. 4H-3-7+YE-5]|nr:hypothetical protein Glaag_0412 [Glaciecola sp. 4H-3-7+YE-5]